MFKAYIMFFSVVKILIHYDNKLAKSKSVWYKISFIQKLTEVQYIYGILACCCIYRTKQYGICFIIVNRNLKKKLCNFQIIFARLLN